ncbi:unnamed protein product [Haemonchus placei]|uniref:Reverse transcriptase domain-containing protein n=1 Tax=Haemonchus placei TaxID=6290 RepID=A0A0N4WYK1_HAEPC|nr:unnamed protein product [Haemonchus placei]
MHPELYDNFTTGISPFYKEFIINCRSREYHASFDLRVKVDGRYLYHLRFADDIVIITPNIEQAELMLAEFGVLVERSAQG